MKGLMKKNKNKSVTVKTIYHPHFKRNPSVTEYPSQKEAESMVEATKKWGVGIESCEILEEKRK